MPFLSLSPSPACASICIPLGWREEGAGVGWGGLVSHPAVPRGGGEGVLHCFVILRFT